MEEAASLFGPADSTSDPFGSIVTSGGDDHARGSTSSPSGAPLSDAREADIGNDWLNGSSNHYQNEHLGSLQPEYHWQGSDDAGGHYNAQPHYEGSTPTSFTYHHEPANTHVGDNMQYMASHDVGHVYGTQQHYEPSVEQSSFEQSSTLRSSGGLQGDPTSSVHARAAHVQPVHPATSDPYRPATQQSSDSGSSSMYPKPSSSSAYDYPATYSAYQPMANNSRSVPQPGYQSYAVRTGPLSPPVPHTHQLGAKDQLPPGQTTALYRPKKTNAYDPPIPPPKPARHVSGALGSSRMFSPTGSTQTYAAQDARHVTYYTNPNEQPSSNIYTPQTHVPAPPIITYPASNAQPASSISPPRRDPHSRILPRSSIPAESSSVGGNAPYSIQLESESSYPQRNTFDHIWPQHVAENAPNQLGYSPPVPRENEVARSRADTQPVQRGEFPTRIHGTSLSGNYPDTGGSFTQHPSSYSPEVAPPLAPPTHIDSHGSPGYVPTVERVQSPGSSSVRSARSTRSHEVVSPPPSSVAAGPASYTSVPVGPRAESGSVTSRVSSPASVRSWKSPQVPSYGPYAPVHNTETSSTARDRSMSNSSLVSSHSSVTSDPYAPSRLGHNATEVSVAASLHQISGVPVHDTDRSHSQTLILPAQTHAPYAPSPSLLGSNDPLGRTSSRAPVVSFGFGGKLVLCFHGSNTLNTGFDIALSSRQTTGIQMRSLHTAIPESAVDHISTSFPGPLFCDPGSPTGLVRAGVATQSKNNKAKVIKYLEGRAEEISRGLGYLNQGSSELRQAEGKLILVNLLRVFLEHDGHLSGSPQVEAAVRAILVPRLGDVSGLEVSTSPKAALYGHDSATTQSLSSSSFNPRDRVLSAQTVKASALDKIQELLAQGERKIAYRYALDERLWAHAMIIASSIDKEAWKEVVNEFIRSELNTHDVGDALRPGQRDSYTGREPLKVAYSLFSGQGAASIQALVPPTSLTKLAEKPQPSVLSHVTPATSNFTSHATTINVPVDVLKKWPETAAMLIPGPSVTECSAALLSLGDCLLANHSVEAAHACYLLAPQSTVLGNIGSSGRIPLVGSRGPTAIPNFHVSDDAIVFSEIVEFALSLAPSKGPETFNGLPRLQTYKFIRAASLAEMGHMLAASRYCEAIAACLNRTHTLPHPELSEQLRDLTDRLIGAPHLDKTGSWIRGKVTRPSLDSLGNWLGGRLTEFVAGSDDSPTVDGDTTPHDIKSFAGPFSHYSTITPSTTSKVPSPQPTVVNHHTLLDAQSKPPRRTGSAQAVRLNPQVPIDRASSAMEYRPTHRNSSPTPRIASASAATSLFSQAISNYTGYTQADVTNGSYHRLESELSDGETRTGAWWGSSNTEDPDTTPPAVAMFINNGRSSPPSGFVSLMDAPPIPAMPVSGVPSRTPTLATQDDEDEDGDLGLGNSSKRLNDSSASQNSNSAQGSKATEPDAHSQLGSKPGQQSSGWFFSRWWNKEGSGGPIKATLGEQSSFVYDKELKRWVNKKAGAEAAQPTAPPPPPSRAQTTSPGRSVPRMANGASLAPPPARAASAIDLTASPPKRMVPRPRSALPPTGDGIANGLPPPASRMTDSPSPGPSGSPTPPPSRPRSQATKRNIRSRYVDVFQQPDATT